MDKPNCLINEKSPYLLLHAYNPVSWYPWGEEAFEKARTEDKPVFLSIGYSACHWCHVMSRESFEDNKVARLLNEDFIPVKVDREERPDVDQLYMKLCHMLTGSGGWPLTIIMTPDKKPFFAATYIPKKTASGKIGLLELLPQLVLLWSKEKQSVKMLTDRMMKVLHNIPYDTPGRMREEILDKTFDRLASIYDYHNGGFGSMPKFPMPQHLFFLLRYWKRTGERKALMMVEETLARMRFGAIFDQLGFGFHRYATDSKWNRPHFEKMLYDQAMLSIIYIEAYQATRNEFYRKTAEEIFSYVLRDMVSPEGGFFSSEDADSDGEEGSFYKWTEKEIREILPESEAEDAIVAYNIQGDGNYDDEGTCNPTGDNVLYLPDYAQLKVIRDISKKLFLAREKRAHPLKNKNILADWNSLMIVALAMGARVFGNNHYLLIADKAVSFIQEKMFTKEGRMLHVFRKEYRANLDDYAFFTWALIEMYESSFDERYLSAALDASNQMIEYFHDKANEGFFFTPKDGEALLSREKEAFDSSNPSGNSIALLNFSRLAKLTDNKKYEKIADQMIKSFAPEIADNPASYTFFLSAFDFFLYPCQEIVIAGNMGDKNTKDMINALNSGFFPNKIVAMAKGMKSFLPEHIKKKERISNKATAYICTDTSCKEPVTDPKKMLELLS